MNTIDEKLKKPLSQILSYRPKTPPKQPTTHPSKDELEQVFIFNGQRVVLKE